MVLCGEPCFAYRLSDIVNGYMRRHSGSNFTERICIRWPDTLGCACLRQKKCSTSFICAAAARVVPSDHPPRDSLVVHLRLGDVLDWPYYRYHKRCNAHRGCQYVLPLRTYETFRIPNVSSAVLLGDPHYRFREEFGNGRSIAYRDNVSAILRKRGLRVHVRPPGFPDDDLMYAMNARYLLLGKGGFARLMRACSRGTVLKNFTR